MNFSNKQLAVGGLALLLVGAGGWWIGSNSGDGGQPPAIAGMDRMMGGDDDDGPPAGFENPNQVGPGGPGAMNAGPGGPQPMGMNPGGDGAPQAYQGGPSSGQYPQTPGGGQYPQTPGGAQPQYPPQGGGVGMDAGQGGPSMQGGSPIPGGSPMQGGDGGNYPQPNYGGGDAGMYRDPNGRFAIRVPGGWQTIPQSGGVVVSRGSSMAMVSAFSGAQSGEQIVTTLARQYGSQWRNLQLTDRGQFQINGAPAAYMMMNGMSPRGVQSLLRLAGTVRGGQGYAIIISTPLSEFNATSPQLQAIESSFTFGGG